MSLQRRKPTIEQVDDRPTRVVLEEVWGQLLGLHQLLDDVLEVENGRAILKGGLVPREVTNDPTTTATAGRRREVVEYNGALYQNRGTSERPLWAAM